MITFSLLSLLCANSAGAPAHRLHGLLSHTMELKSVALRPCPPSWIHADGWNADPLQLQESSQRRAAFLGVAREQGARDLCCKQEKEAEETGSEHVWLENCCPPQNAFLCEQACPSLLSAGGCMCCHMFHNVLSQISLEKDHYSDRGSQKE